MARIETSRASHANKKEKEKEEGIMQLFWLLNPVLLALIPMGMVDLTIYDMMASNSRGNQQHATRLSHFT